MGADLAPALAAVARREAWLEVRCGAPAGNGWARADLLLRPDAVADLVATGAEHLAADHPSAPAPVRRAVAAALLLNDWAWTLGTVAAGVLALAGAVPSLAPREVTLRVRDGRVDGIAVTGRPSRCDGDPLDAVLGELAAHQALLHDAVTRGPRPLLRRGPHGLSAGMGDGLAQAVLRQASGCAPDERDRLLQLAERLLDRAPAGWGRADWIPTQSVATPVTRRRGSCCLWYRLPGEQACVTCPRLGDSLRAAAPPA